MGRYCRQKQCYQCGGNHLQRDCQGARKLRYFQDDDNSETLQSEGTRDDIKDYANDDIIDEIRKEIPFIENR